MIPPFVYATKKVTATFDASSFLANCVYYFDRQLSSASQTDGISSDDLSLCGNRVIQSTQVNAPTFSKTNGLSFDKTKTQYLTFQNDDHVAQNSIFVPEDSWTAYFKVNRKSTSDSVLISSPLIILKDGYIRCYGVDVAISDNCLGNCLIKIKQDYHNIYFYKDGNLIGQFEWSTTNIQPAQTHQAYFNFAYTIGGYPSYPTFDGDFHTIAFFDKFLTPSEETYIEDQILHPKRFDSIIKENIDVAIEHGQSNGDAAGGEGLPNWPSYLRTFTNGLINSPSRNAFVPVNTLQRTDFSSSFNFFGFEMQFSYNYYQTYGKPLYILKYTLGGSALDNSPSNQSQGIWYPATNITGRTNIWKNLLSFYPYFHQKMKQAKKIPNYRFCIWMQGEQDACFLAPSNNYQGNEVIFIQAVRDIFGLPSLPFIVFNINGAGDSMEVYKSTVKAAKVYNSTHVTNYYLIDTESYETIDGVHYTIPYLITGGDSAFNIYQNNIAS